MKKRGKLEVVWEYRAVDRISVYSFTFILFLETKTHIALLVISLLPLPSTFFSQHQ